MRQKSWAATPLTLEINEQVAEMTRAFDGQESAVGATMDPSKARRGRISHELASGRGRRATQSPASDIPTSSQTTSPYQIYLARGGRTARGAGGAHGALPRRAAHARVPQAPLPRG